MTDPRWLEPVKQRWSAYQRRSGLVADGLPGGKTLGAVEALEARLEAPVPPQPPFPEYTFSDGVPIRKDVNRDPALLLPPFADKVQHLYNRMLAEGHDPMVFEGYRTKERALELYSRGSGIIDSMHTYGVAADILSESGWWTASSDFWKFLRSTALDLGLHVLYKNGQSWDLAHVQAIAVKDQDRFRAMTDAERLAFVS